MNDIPADAAPTTEEPAPPVPPGEPSSLPRRSARPSPRARTSSRRAPTEAPPPPTPNPQSTAGMDVTTSLVDCPPGLAGQGHRKGRRDHRAPGASGAHITVDQNFPEGVPRKISISARRVRRHRHQAGGGPPRADR